MINFIFTCQVLSIFIFGSTLLKELADVLGTVSIALLSYIALLQLVRDKIPNIPKITHAERIIVANIIYSMYPILASIFGGKDYEPNFTVNLSIFLVFNFVIISIVIYKYCKIRPSLHQEVPKQ